MRKCARFDALKSHYIKLWSTMHIRNDWYAKVAYVASKVAYYAERYKRIDIMPWYIIGCIHYRESNFSFSHHLHNGDPLTWWTVSNPKGRPVGLTPPFRWEDSARDALLLKQHLFPPDGQWTIERILFFLEGYNGFGYYLYRNINSPYLWNGSNHYIKGKYRSDGRYDANLIDKQVGCACIIYYGLQHQLWEI